MLNKLKRAVDYGLIRNLDFYFARQLSDIDGEDNPELLLASALVSHSIGQGNICIALESLAGDTLHAEGKSSFQIELPAFKQWRESIHTSSVIGKPGEIAPLILDEKYRLYLGRYWWYEQEVAEALRSRAVTYSPHEVDNELLQESLSRMFPSADNETDWQKVAAALAVLRKFSVISGGPGTGKTHTVTSILALLLEQAGEQPLRIALAAPTGKAASRLTESIRNAKPVIQCSDVIRNIIPEKASTIHRLLGFRPGEAEPRFNLDNPLHIDVLVVDEASMIDLPLMARLVRAIPEHTRLIMLGDKDQLASVEAGSVFADICGDEPEPRYSDEFRITLERCVDKKIDAKDAIYPVENSIALLRKSYRFSSEKGIGVLAEAINLGDAKAALSVFEKEFSDIHLYTPEINLLEEKISKKALEVYSSCFKAEDPQQALSRFNAFRILCAIRGSVTGVENINGIIEQALQQSGLIKEVTQYYMGRPIMIRSNDYTIGLFNGDMGILWPDPEANNELRAWFVLPDNTMKKVLPSLLPTHETAYAMTVHKSQGSEFEEVLMLLPYTDVSVVTRELVYTGITRGKKRAEVWGDKEILSLAVKRRVERVSGLGEKIQSNMTVESP